MPLQLHLPRHLKTAVPADRPALAVDWTGIWAVSLGAVTMALAAVVYWTSRDGTATALTLLGPAAIIGAVAGKASEKPDR